MERPMQIVFFNDFYDPNVIGGVEVFLQTLAKGLHEAGNRIQIITPRYRGSAQIDSRDGILVKRIGAYPHYRRFLRLAIGSSPRLQDRLDTRECRELLESFGDETIIHFHNLWGFSPTVMRKFSGPRVVTVHDYWPFCVRRVMVRIGGELCEGRTFVQCAICHTSAPTSIGSMNPLKPQLWYKNNESLFREVDSIIAPSRYMKEFLQRNLQNSHEVRVIKNGVDTHLFHRLPVVRKQVILFVGRPTPMKGVEFLLRTYENLSSPRPQLVMVGPEPTAVDSPAGVKFLERVPLDKLIELYSESTCLAVPSQWPENCSMTVLEAMSCELPVLASDVGGNAELVRDSTTGFLLPRDSIESWTSAIERLFANQHLVERLGKSARAAVLKEFSIETTISKHMDLYARLAH